MSHDPDRFWITDPNPDHPKGTQPLRLSTQADWRTWSVRVSRSNSFLPDGLRVQIGNSVPSHEEYIEDPGKYDDFDLAMDEAGKS